MFDWMNWLIYDENISIKHKMNYGKEKRVGPYLVDGYDLNTHTIYEFMGCYFHGHKCMTPKNREQHQQRYNRTKERLSYLRN